jgi:hypothetical protein
MKSWAPEKKPPESYRELLYLPLPIDVIHQLTSAIESASPLEYGVSDACAAFSSLRRSGVTVFPVRQIFFVFLAGIDGTGYLSRAHLCRDDYRAS